MQLLGHTVILFCSFLRNCHTFFHKGYTILNSHQQYTMAPISPHFFKHLFSGFLMVAITSVRRMGMRRYLIAIFSCIFIMISDIHLFICLVAIHKSSLRKCLLKSFAHIWIWHFLLFSFRSSLHILANNPSEIYNLQIFSPILWLVDSVFWFIIFLSFHKVQFIYFFFCYLCFWCYIQEITAKFNVIRFILHFLLRFFWRARGCLRS